MKSDVRNKLVELSKLVCLTCEESTQVCYESCLIHKLINEILEGINDG